jgi:oligopeptide transport system permease protein
LGRGRSLWNDAWTRIRRNRVVLAAVAFIALTIVCAALAPLLTRYDFATQQLGEQFQPPSAEHWFGTDHLGRDVFARMVYGARISMVVGIAVQVIILLIGVPIGLAAGYFNRADRVLMRLVDVLYAFPDVLLVTILVGYLRGVWGRAPENLPVHVLQTLDGATGGLLGVFVALGLTHWLTVARLVRGEVLALRGQEFVLAARATGARGARILLSHLLPNCLGVILVATTFGIPRAIILEAGLSFLGIGVQTPFPSWGIMIAEGISGMRSSPHLVVAPALAISLTILSFNYLGDGLRDALDPRLRR